MAIQGEVLLLSACGTNHFEVLILNKESKLSRGDLEEEQWIDTVMNDLI